MTDEQKKEFTLKITNANKSELIVIVYDIALQYISDAKDCFDKGEICDFQVNSRRAMRCVGDLLEALNFDYEASYPLMRLYVFFSKQLSLAALRKEKAPLENVERLMLKLRKSFETIAESDDSLPLMGNAEEVYAGLTYSRGSLNESIEGNLGRGFCV